MPPSYHLCHDHNGAAFTKSSMPPVIKDMLVALMAILLLHEGRTITDVHHLTGAARSTIGRWLRWYRDEGIDALEAFTGWPCPSLTYRQDCHPTGAAHAVFLRKIFGYQRSRWCTELLAIKINRLTGLNVAASTLRRWLPRMGIVWRRPVPTLRIKDPAYQEKWRISTPRWPAVMPIIPVFL